LNTATQVGQQNVQQGAQATQQIIKATSQAGQQTAQAASENGQQAPGSTRMPIMRWTLRKGKPYLYMIVG
jgi:hypothetical protein